MTQHTHQSHGNLNHMRMQKNPLPHHTMSNHIKTQTMNPKNHDMNPKNKVTTVKCLLANEMIMTCHVRHVLMSIDQTIKK